MSRVRALLRAAKRRPIRREMTSCLMRNRRFGQPEAPVFKLVVLLMLVAENVLCWNCRGAGSKEFVCELKEMMRGA